MVPACLVITRQAQPQLLPVSAIVLRAVRLVVEVAVVGADSAVARAEAEEPQGGGSMATLIVLLCAFLFVVWYYLTYNNLVSFRNSVEQSWSNVEVELKRRFDLIQNLVAVVKGYAAHERETLEKITSLRTKADSISNPNEATAIQNEMSQALTKLVAIAEAYPQLKADTQFLELQQELTETENRIAERRSAYNQTVNLYLNRRQAFPGNIIAQVHSFTAKAFFDAPDELVNSVPNVSRS